MSTQSEDRLADVHRRLNEANQLSAGAAEVVRDSLERFRIRLSHLQEQGDAADDRRWADYVSVLDRGLDELELEISRVATESVHPGQGVAEVLAIHTSELELAGWRMQFSLHDTASDPAGVRTSIAVAESELERCRAARGEGAEIPADALEQSMEQVRETARQARTTG